MEHILRHVSFLTVKEVYGKLWAWCRKGQYQGSFASGREINKGMLPYIDVFSEAENIGKKKTEMESLQVYNFKRL